MLNRIFASQESEAHMSFRLLAHGELPDIPVNNTLRTILGIKRDSAPTGAPTKPPNVVVKPITHRSRLRFPEPCAYDTLISNAGANPATIYENNILIFVLAAGESKHVPQGGKGNLEADTTGATITVVTRAHVCDQSYTPPSVAPIGSFLL